MVIIGVIGSNGINLISNIINEKITNIKKKSIIIDDEENIDNVKSIKSDLDYVIINMSSFLNWDNENLINDVNILVVTEFDSENVEYLEKIEKVIRRINDGGYIIFNLDSFNKVNLKLGNVFPISYGFNGKATVTASSIEDIDKLNFSYCLQRSISTISDEVVRPFEVPISVKGNSDDISLYLAAYTCCLIIDIKKLT